MRKLWLVVAGLAAVSCTGEDLPTSADSDDGVGTRAGLQTVGAVVTVSDGGYLPSAVSVAQGDSVRWNFTERQQHTVTDASGMGLFNFRKKSGSSWYRFTAAGTYDYWCTRHSAQRGVVRVPIRVSPGSGDTNTSFDVVWAAAPQKSGYVFDVEIQRPGASTFAPWMTGAAAAGVSFVPDAGPGTYAFQARLRNTFKARSSGYSPATSIEVSRPSSVPGLQLVASGLSFPLFLTSPAGDGRQFIVERGGRIKVLENGQVRATPFLDISSRITTVADGGLLSMAFHPRYASNGRFFIFYSDVGGTIEIAEYRVSADPNVADPTQVASILSLPKPFGHIGGLLAFGPDGRLYHGMGDGGGTNTISDAGQDLSSPMGKILRFDVDLPPPYVPADNPFVDDPDAHPEIWAYGVRNPWRYSFDRETGDLYVADVGQDVAEEVNFVPAPDFGGQNYGWNVTEGSSCFPPGSSCDRTGITLPVYEYPHSAGACSITGGYVYRGGAMPDLQGTYFYADYCLADVYSLRVTGGVAGDHRTWPALSPPTMRVVSFGEDAVGEIYVLTGNAGSVYKIVPQ